MRVESMGTRTALVMSLNLKFSSGRAEKGRVRSVVVGIWRRDGVIVAMLGCDKKVGFETRSSGSEGGRTAAEAIVATLSTFCNENLIVTFDQDLEALESIP